MRHSYKPSYWGVWRDFEQALDVYGRNLDALTYSDTPSNTRASPLEEIGRMISGIFNVTASRPGSSASSQSYLFPELIEGLLGYAMADPHGYDLLEPNPLPRFPQFPQQPPPDPRPGLLSELLGIPPSQKPGEPTANDKQRILKRARDLQHRADALQEDFEVKFKKNKARLNAVKAGCVANEPPAIRLLISISHISHLLPDQLRGSFEVDLDLDARIALCTIEIPDFRELQIMKRRRRDWVPVSASEKKRVTENIPCALCLRAAYLTAKSDAGDWFDTIAVNARQNWIDRAIGQPRSGIIASLQASSHELLGLRLDQLDPKACFRHLKGISTPSVEDIVPVRPIFVMNKNDSRIVRERDVAQGLEPEANLAAMPWEDFEHLVRQLYEWEFGKTGAEVRVTRSSRDRGVDAIVFDPDPLRGGKFVIQAKRYTRPVDVAAVRDLYGTLLNEGANRGILVTTSNYGPDAYAFARDKPISLVDGPNLIAMLRKHGRQYKIDLDEARKLAAIHGTDF